MKKLFYKIKRFILITLFNKKFMKIQSYDYKREYPDLKKENRYFGVELELINKKTNGQEYSSSEVIQKLADLISPLFTDWAFFKSDGSLEGKGFEIVTVPLILEDQYKNWSEELFKILDEKEFLSYNASVSCGLHVHVSRNSLTDLQLGKVLKFLHNKENRIFLKKIAQRHSEDYAEFKSAKRFGYIKKEQYKNKYDAFNLGHKDTVEFRLFRGTLNHDAFHKNLEFCDAILNFCSPCLFSVNESSSWWNFANYISNNKKKYFYLWNYLVMKEIESVDSWKENRERKKANKEKGLKIDSQDSKEENAIVF